MMAFLLGSLGRTLQEGIDEHEILFLNLVDE